VKRANVMRGDRDDEMLMAMVSEELDTLETRLGQLEVEMLGRSDNGNMPVLGAGTAAPLEEALAQALKNDRR
jgi:hypothetical protein